MESFFRIAVLCIECRKVFTEFPSSGDDDTWYKEDDPVIPDGTSVYVSSVSHTLLMRDVGEEEEGRYH